MKTIKKEITIIETQEDGLYVIDWSAIMNDAKEAFSNVCEKDNNKSKER